MFSDYSDAAYFCEKFDKDGFLIVPSYPASFYRDDDLAKKMSGLLTFIKKMKLCLNSLLCLDYDSKSPSLFGVYFKVPVFSSEPSPGASSTFHIFVRTNKLVASFPNLTDQSLFFEILDVEEFIERGIKALSFIFNTKFRFFFTPYSYSGWPPLFLPASTKLNKLKWTSNSVDDLFWYAHSYWIDDVNLLIYKDAFGKAISSSFLTCGEKFRILLRDNSLTYGQATLLSNFICHVLLSSRKIEDKLNITRVLNDCLKSEDVFRFFESNYEVLFNPCNDKLIVKGDVSGSWSSYYVESKGFSDKLRCEEYHLFSSELSSLDPWSGVLKQATKTK